MNLRSCCLSFPEYWDYGHHHHTWLLPLLYVQDPKPLHCCRNCSCWYSHPASSLSCGHLLSDSWKRSVTPCPSQDLCSGYNSQWCLLQGSRAESLVPASGVKERCWQLGRVMWEEGKADVTALERHWASSSLPLSLCYLSVFLSFCLSLSSPHPVPGHHRAAYSLHHVHLHNVLGCHRPKAVLSGDDGQKTLEL